MKKYIKLSGNPQSISSVTGEQRQLAFQLWVAYDLYGRCKEDSAGQLRCPLIGCSTSFESLGSCLQHLPTCAWLSNSWYWCPLCQRPERFTEPGPILAQPPKLESGPGTPKCATLLPQKSTVAKISTTRFWKHIRNKSNFLSAHRILPMYPSRHNVGQSPPEDEGGFQWDRHAFHPVQSAAAGTSMQYPELESAPNYYSNDAWLSQLLELESQSYSPNTWMAQTQPIEHDSHPYGANNLISSERRPELESLPISQRSELQGLYYSGPAQRYEPPLQPVDSVPTRLTPARHEGLSNTLGFNNTPARQSISFGQSSCQTSPFLDRSSQPGHGQARAMAKMESVEGQSIRKTVGRHNFPQPDPSADYSDAVTCTSPCCSDEALLRTMATNNSITSIPYPSKERLPALRSGDHLMANHTPGRPNQTVYLASLESQGPLKKHNHQQQNCSISPLAASDTTLGASSSIVSPVSSNEARGVHSNHGQTLPMTPNESPTIPGPSSLSDRSSARTSVSNSTTGKPSIEGSRVTSWEQCSRCGKPFNGSVQDRKHNKKRHDNFHCPARAGPQNDFICPTDGCNKRYNRPDNLAAHCREKH